MTGRSDSSHRAVIVTGMPAADRPAPGTDPATTGDGKGHREPESRHGCEDPAHCAMPVGAVVRTRTSGALHTRGVVEWSHGHGDAWARSQAPILAENDAIIRLAETGSWRITNAHDEWEIVPSAERTTIERLRSAGLTYEKLTGSDDDYEPDSPIFAWICSLFTPAERNAALSDGDWPASVWELLCHLARALDNRQATDDGGPACQEPARDWPPDDGELPGMWERADFTGGLDVVRGPGWSPDRDAEGPR